jgi:hypothetical protein
VGGRKERRDRYLLLAGLFFSREGYLLHFLHSTRESSTFAVHFPRLLIANSPSLPCGLCPLRLAAPASSQRERERERLFLGIKIPVSSGRGHSPNPRSQSPKAALIGSNAHTKGQAPAPPLPSKHGRSGRVGHPRKDRLTESLVWQVLERMAKLRDHLDLPGLTPVPAVEEEKGGDPRPVYECDLSTTWRRWSFLHSYTPSGGGAPHLVAAFLAQDEQQYVGVWDTGTGEFLRALRAGGWHEHLITVLITYQRPPDGQPRIAAGYARGRLDVWDGDGRLLHEKLQTTSRNNAVGCLTTYSEPTGGRTRLVSG